MYISNKPPRNQFTKKATPIQRLPPIHIHPAPSRPSLPPSYIPSLSRSLPSLRAPYVSCSVKHRITSLLSLSPSYNSYVRLRPAVTGAMETLVPPWLEPLLKAPFFTTCRLHGVSTRSERNMFCLDCPSAAAFCFYCRSAHHSGHRTVQIRRSSYHDVVRVAEIQKVLDVTGVQTYVINSARVIFLNERPQPKGGGGSGGGSSSTVITTAGVSGKGGGGPQICEICSRTLLDPPFRFCSLGCKLERAKRHGDTSFQLEDENGERVSAMESEAIGIGDEKAKRWRRRGRVPASEESQGGGGEQDIINDFQSPPPRASPTTLGSRRRKGIPHRSPLASS